MNSGRSQRARLSRSRRRTPLRIGGVPLGKYPLLAVPLGDDDVGRDSAAIREIADLIELRVDLFRSLELDHVRRVAVDVKEATGLPLIGTVRWQKEGGGARLTEAHRAELYEALTPVVDAVDVELRAPIRRRVVAAAQKHGRVAILSYHNLARTPSTAALRRIAGRAPRESLFKIACMAHCAEDIAQLLEFTLRYRARGVVTIAMGELGAISRILFPLAGSEITYGYHRMATAPGQLSARDLREALDRFYRRPSLPR